MQMDIKDLKKQTTKDNNHNNEAPKAYKTENDIIEIFNSDEDNLQETKTIDTKVGHDLPTPMECVEQIDLVPAVESLSTRTRSSRRPNKKSYCEDELNISYNDEQSSATSTAIYSKFPKTATKPLFKADPSKIPKNNNIKIFHSNFLYKSFCFLCGCSDKNLAVHYARKHPDTEVFVARVSPFMANCIRKNENLFVNINGQIHGHCPFCEEEQTMNRDDWMKHLLNHTGEQLYFCTGCKTSMMRKINHGNCSKEQVQNIFNNNLTDEDVFGFICNTCNYVQIREEQLIRHTSNEHNSFDEVMDEFFSKVILVKCSNL